MTQNQLILRHLLAGRPLTALLALQKYGCLRLAARVADLRAAGHPIQRRWVKTPLTQKTVAQYYIAPQPTKATKP